MDYRGFGPVVTAYFHATFEAMRWLVDNYGLSLPDANNLPEMYVEYDVGNVFDPTYTIVCKISKYALPTPVDSALVPL